MLRSYTSPDAFIYIPDSLRQEIGDDQKLKIDTATHDDLKHGSKSGGPSSKENVKSVPKLIFFITGNPGLIGYYHEFLTLLARDISAARHKNCDDEDTNTVRAGDCVIAGFSLGGFEISSSASMSLQSSPDTRLSPATSGSERDLSQELCFPLSFRPQGAKSPNQAGGIYSLRDQISLCLARIDALTGQMKLDFGAIPDRSDSKQGTSQASQEVAQQAVEVLIMGHSVGAYIAMEVTRLWFELNKNPSSTSVSPSTTLSASLPAPPSSWRPTSLILLTPTILNISHSSSGKIATPILSNVQFFPELLQFGSRLLTGGLSESWLRWIVAKVTGMSPGPALESTVQFLRSGRGVKQALAMARDEMREIGVNQWEDEVWGIVKDEPGDAEVGESNGHKTRLKMFLWFAKADHWVADTTRDEIVNLKRREKSTNETDNGPMVTVDETEGLLHAWCLQQNAMVAERVKVWIRKAFAQDQ